jgi:hypothetical protein
MVLGKFSVGGGDRFAHQTKVQLAASVLTSFEIKRRPRGWEGGSTVQFPLLHTAVVDAVSQTRVPGSGSPGALSILRRFHAIA